MSAARTPDPAIQQRAAADPAASVWVAASAGTGKTKVLTDRVLSLLLAGSAPSRILCLTFTKAAAAEMAIRVQERLSEWATVSDAKLRKSLKDLTGADAGPETLDRARRLFARVLDAPGGMRIETIHAFCQSLLRRFPLEAGIPPHFQVMEERSAREALEQARAEVLESARAGGGAALKDALDTVTQLVSEQAFAELIQCLAQERARLERVRDSGIDAFETKLRQHLGLKPGETAEGVLREACRHGACDEAALRAAAEILLGSESVRDQKAGQRIADWLADPAERADGFDEYLLVFFTQKNKRRERIVTTGIQETSPDEVAALLHEAERLEAVRARRDAALLATATVALLRLGGAVLDSYDAHKAARALLDFEDLILKSMALLREPGVAPWVLFKLDGGLDHILIDEAQDTNPEQWEVVRLLAEEFFVGAGARERLRTIFAVGDPKQSIFSFQRADPTKFADMREYFAGRVKAIAAKWSPVDLEISFRSVRSVLETVDKVFAYKDAATGVTPDGSPTIHVASRLGAGGLVELWPPIGPEDGPAIEPWDAPLSQTWPRLPQARLALAIAATVKRWIESGEKLPARGRPIRAGDVMVLVRRRTSFVGALVRALKERGVPVAGVDRMLLAEQLAVEDMVALGQFLLLPEDDLTLATVLKGPLYGFDDDALFALAHGRRGTLWGELRRRAAEQPRFAHAAEQLGALLARVDFTPPYELFAEVLAARRGRHLVLERLGPEAADPLDEFLAASLAYERGHGASLQGFLHWLVLGETEVKRDLNNETGRDEVRVITVHGAKGLQAPIVFLPDTLQVPRQTTPVLWTPDGLPLWCQQGDAPIAAAARDAAKAKREEEYRRLLYVALTRAEDRLYVCGWHGRQNPPDENWYQFVAAGMKAAGAKPFVFDARKLIGDDGWQGEGLRLVSRQIGPAVDDKRLVLAAAEKSALPKWATSPPPPEPVPPRPLAPSRPTHDEPATRSPLGADRGFIFRKGLLIHRLLQSLPLLAPDRRAAAAARFLARPFFDLVGSEQQAIAAETLAILKHPDFAPLFGPGSEAEVPVVGLVGGRAVSGRIDRLLVTADSVLIVDYKTMRPVPADESQVPAAYLEQLGAYRAALGGVYPGKAIRCALLWTEGPSLMAISAAALA